MMLLLSLLLLDISVTITRYQCHYHCRYHYYHSSLSLFSYQFPTRLSHGSVEREINKKSPAMHKFAQQTLTQFNDRHEKPKLQVGHGFGVGLVQQRPLSAIVRDGAPEPFVKDPDDVVDERARS